MFFWLSFHISIIFLCVLFANTKKKLYQAVIATLICCILVYFSGFRDGLGSDYEQYISRIEWLSSIDNVTFLAEPLFSFISYIIYKTSLSEIFLPFICAFITNIGIVLFCYSEKKYFPWMILLYVFVPVLFAQSFNLVRQFFAIGLFYYSLRYIGVSLWKYMLLVLLAGTMHFSAFMLIPLYWVLDKKLNKKWIIPVALSFFIILPVINNYLVLGKYFESDSLMNTTMTSSGFTVVYNIIMMAIFFSRRLYNNINPIYLNLLILLVLFIDASYLYYGYYRFAIYFIPIVIYLIPYIFSQYKQNFGKFLVVFFLIIVYYNSLFVNIDNTTIVPQKILKVSQLFD